VTFALRRRQNRGHKICETLPNTRAGFRHEMALGCDCSRYCVRHFHLLRPLLVIRQPCSDAAIRAKNVGGRKFHSANVADVHVRQKHVM